MRLSSLLLFPSQVPLHNVQNALARHDRWQQPEVTVHGVNISRADAARFAPIVYLHPREPYLPCSIEDLLEKSTLRDASGDTLSARPTQQDLFTYRNASAHLALDVEAYAGRGVDAPVYVSVQVPSSTPAFIDFNYVFLYGYNGAQTARVRLPFLSYDVELPSFAEHEGDVETITVRVTPDMHTMLFLRVEGHGHSNVIVAERHVGRPEVSAALNSHAVYVAQGDRNIVTEPMHKFGIGVDFTDVVSQSGPRWAPNEDNLVFIGLNDDGDPITSEGWAAFAGTIGSSWTNTYEGARGLGFGPLRGWQMAWANFLGAAASKLGLTRAYDASDGTAGLGSAHGFTPSAPRGRFKRWLRSACRCRRYLAQTAYLKSSRAMGTHQRKAIRALLRCGPAYRKAGRCASSR